MNAIQQTGGCRVAPEGPRGVDERRVSFVPAVDVLETAEAVTIVADTPGARPQDIELEFESGVLTVTAPVTDRAPDGGRRVLREYEIGDFKRSFRIGPSIDSGRISASATGGVLTVTLPKSEAARARRIDVHEG